MTGKEKREIIEKLEKWYDSLDKGGQFAIDLIARIQEKTNGDSHIADFAQHISSLGRITCNLIQLYTSPCDKKEKFIRDWNEDLIEATPDNIRKHVYELTDYCCAVLFRLNHKTTTTMEEEK